MRCTCEGSGRPCACATPVQKCLVLGCYQPGIEDYDNKKFDEKFPVRDWKWCGPHGRREAKIQKANEECATELQALGDA